MWPVSCGADPPGDAGRYAQAAGHGVTACEGIVNADIADECRVWAARDLAAQGELDDALAVCRDMAVGPWRDECWFLIADTVGARGQQALDICGDAGRWWQQCVGHAINREAQMLFDQAAVGDEARLQMGLVHIIERYIQGGEVTDRARRMLVAHIAGREADQPFSLVICGDAGQDICRDAYLERVRLASESSGRSWRAACGRFVTVERVTQVGMPGWAPDADAIVQEGWQKLCER